ncbi:MAG: hypothetical protein COC01_07465 [Bacteroidetes bacterium]|nr:MAG: hypothetical protein COC01_07465 [Bacteroidota bacterium]
MRLFVHIVLLFILIGNGSLVAQEEEKNRDTKINFLLGASVGLDSYGYQKNEKAKTRLTGFESLKLGLSINDLVSLSSRFRYSHLNYQSSGYVINLCSNCYKGNFIEQHSQNYYHFMQKLDLNFPVEDRFKIFAGGILSYLRLVDNVKTIHSSNIESSDYVIETKKELRISWLLTSGIIYKAPYNLDWDFSFAVPIITNWYYGHLNIGITKTF